MAPQNLYSLSGKRIWVAGHNGMVGTAVTRQLKNKGIEVLTCTRGEVDLRRQSETEAWMDTHNPQVVFLAAATVGGILANDSRPAEFIYDNLLIEANIIHSARKIGVEKLLCLGSSCIYPKMAPQPIAEKSLLSGPLEPTNQWYAVAKIAGIKMCQAYRAQYGCDFITVQPCNLFGPGDNFDLQSSHVIPALMRKASEAKRQNSPDMEVWGSGTPKREFLYVEDLADALIFLMENYSGSDPINVGTGRDLTIRELAETICAVVGFTGNLQFNTDMADGTPRKILDAGRMSALGWHPKTSLKDGLKMTFEWFLEQQSEA